MQARLAPCKSRLLSLSNLILVDESENVSQVIQECLEQRGFETMPIATVGEALRHISAEHAAVLLSEMHELEATEKIIVLSAVRHSHPGQVTVALRNAQALHTTIEAVLPHVDEVYMKSISLDEAHAFVEKRLSNPGARLAVLAGQGIHSPYNGT